MQNRVLSSALLSVALSGTLLLVSCGGGGASGSNNPPPPPPPPGDFSLTIDQPTISVQQGGTFQIQGVQTTSINNFTGTISLSFSGLPSGITTIPPAPVSVASGSLASVDFAASAIAAAGQSTVTVAGTSGDLSHSATFNLTVTPPAPFSIQVSPQSLSLAPGTSATVQVSLTASPGTSPQLEVSGTLPPNIEGINIPFPEYVLSLANPTVSLVVNATPFAQPLQNFPLVVVADDDPNYSGDSAAVIVPLTVSVPFSVNTAPTRSTFFRTSQSPTGMVYDQARKLLFVSVEILDEVIVLSSVDGHEVATIPVQYPTGIDESADGTAVYVVSPFFNNITTIDPNLLQVVGQTAVPTSVAGTTLDISLFQLATLSTGEVLFPAGGITGHDFLLWDPQANTFSLVGPSTLINYIGLILRSADHSKVLAYAGSLGGGFLYDAATGAFTGPSTSVLAPAAISPDGSRIVSVGLQNSPTILMDNNFNTVASLQLDAFPVSGIAYSLDGKYIYVFTEQLNSGGNLGTVIDASSFTVAGLVPGFSFGAGLPFSGSIITTFATDETEMLFGAAGFGVGFLDMSRLTSLAQPLPGPFLAQPSLASLTSPTQVVVNGEGGFSQGSLSFYFGAPPANSIAIQATSVSVTSDNSVNLTIPAGRAAGPANVTLTRSDGFFEVMPDAVSFNPTVLRVDADSGSPGGNDSITIFGYGFDAPNMQVTIGGQMAGITQTHTAICCGTLPTESLVVTTPPGHSGPADVTVSAATGSTTVPGGFHYLDSAQIYPIVGALDALTYDQNHQRLYISNEDHNRVEIFNLATNQFMPPVTVGNSPTSVAITPDDALLAVLNVGDGTVSVIQLSTMQLAATYSVLTPTEKSLNCSGMPLDISPAAPHRMLVDVECGASLGGGESHLLNLDNGSLSCLGVVSCGTDGVTMTLDGLAAMASTTDGTQIFLATNTGGGSDLPVYLLNLTANTLTTGFSGDFSDAAVCADGTIFAADFAISNSQLNRIAIMAYEPYADSGSQSFHNVAREKLNPSGSLLFFPQTTGVDIFDVHTGRLARHVAIADGIPFDSNGLVLDETGSKMFLITNSGITITQLDELPLSLATATPSSGSAGTTVRLRGSGFVTGSTVQFGGTDAVTSFVDLNTLNVTVPSGQSGPVRISVTNPDGTTYNFDDAFTIN